MSGLSKFSLAQARIRSVKEQCGVGVTGNLRMERQTKTAPELEQMILSRLRAEMACPPDLQVRVIRVEGRWDAFPEFIEKGKHPECLARVVLIAEDVRTVYDLAG
jgi:hypothetical protein